MPITSPTLEGFRAVFRRPSLTFAEIAWRWTVGAVAWTLFLFSLIEYLNTLPVSRGDKTLLGTRQPVLIGRAISHIFRGSLNRAVFAVLLVAVALALLWGVAACMGRAPTVRALLYCVRTDGSFNICDSGRRRRAGRSIRRRYVFPGTPRTCLRSQHLERYGTPCSPECRWHRSLGASGFHPACSGTGHHRHHHRLGACLFRDRRLALHGTARPVRLPYRHAKRPGDAR